MALLNVILLVELFLIVCSAKNIFKAMTLLNIYCVIYDMYTAFHQVGCFAVLFIWLINFPYILAVIKVVLKSDSIHRRKLLARSFKFNYAFRLVCDFWSGLNIRPAV